jgi:hypothetical protein
MLSKDEKLRLRSLSKEHAENIGLHILAAYALEETEPEQALEHAKWVARQASRVDIARETLALISYRAGDYKTALREFRTAMRMNGQTDYLPFIADSERGLGNPKKTIEIALSDEAKELEGDAKAEMLLVFAGAYADLGHLDQAIKIVDTLSKSRGVSGGYRMRAVQAEQNFLDQAGRHEESLALDDEAERLEDAYADASEDDSEEDIIDNDLEDVPDSVLEGLGIDISSFEEDFDDDEAEGNAEDSEGDDAAASDEADEASETAGSEEPGTADDGGNDGTEADADADADGDDDTEADADADADADDDADDDLDDASVIEVADAEDVVAEEPASGDGDADGDADADDPDNTVSDEILDDGDGPADSDAADGDAADGDSTDSDAAGDDSSEPANPADPAEPANPAEPTEAAQE